MAAACVLASGPAWAAGRLTAPWQEQGLRAPDGRELVAPRPRVWGQALSPAEQRHAERRLAALRRELSSAWISWDPHRDAVRGIITSGLPAPGTTRSAADAEAFAADWLARHLEVLAPGSAPSDFVLVANDLSAGIRSVGFVQLHQGLPVVGGQISFRFKADRLAYVASQALPAIELPPATATRIGPRIARDLASEWIALEVGGTPQASPAPEVVVLPLWTGTAWSYHEVVRVEVEDVDPLGQWWVYLDARSGDPVARQQRILPAVTVRFDVPVRHAAAARSDDIAPELFVVEGGNPTTTDLAGQVTPSADPTTLVTTVDGTRVNVINDAASDASSSFPVTDGETVVWSEAANELSDAQLSAFVHATRVKDYVRAIDPTLAWLDQTIDVTVNLGGSCNAGSNGDSIYFLQSSGMCQNTARLADVVYHEVGHSVHNQALIPGVGSYDSALSEGISDYLAATMVNDSGMGRGFFYDENPLRELDPVGSEWTWPDDIGESHFTGRIIGGTLWDLRTALMGTLGDQAGREHTDRIWYEATRRAVDIPSMYPEALLYDDDDGNLSNGTPNGCEINAAFEAHGLLDPAQLGNVTVSESSVPEGRLVSLSSDFPELAGCPVGLDGASLRWRLRDDPAAVTESAMVLQDGNLVATIPAQVSGTVVEYQLDMVFASGQVSPRPLNAADPWYQTYFGAVQPVYCLDADADLGEWSFQGNGNTWSFGPLGGGSAVDPSDPYDDDGVLLSMDGEYEPQSDTTATGPIIDISGLSDPRLHYYRWLTVEDGFYDQATLYANGQPVWANLVTEIAVVHHQDREWRFHDLPLGDFVEEGQVQLGFRLQSDGGLHMGGWTVDALCVVEVVEQVCGDGQLTGNEQCDDGNLEDGDGCDAQCVPEDDPDPPGTTDDGALTSDGLDESGTAGGPDDAGGPTSGEDGSTGAAQDDAGASDGCSCTSPGDRRDPARASWALLLLGLGRRRRR